MATNEQGVRAERRLQVPGMILALAPVLVGRLERGLLGCIGRFGVGGPDRREKSDCGDQQRDW